MIIFYVVYYAEVFLDLVNIETSKKFHVGRRSEAGCAQILIRRRTRQNAAHRARQLLQIEKDLYSRSMTALFLKNSYACRCLDDFFSTD